MSAHMKKHLTKDDITILVKGKEVELKSTIKSSFVNIINELVDFDSFNNDNTHGDWTQNARLRVAKYLKGARKREGFTQNDVVKKLKIQQGNLSKMESGERPIPKALQEKFAQLYGIKKKMINESQVRKLLKNKAA